MKLDTSSSSEQSAPFVRDDQLHDTSYTFTQQNETTTLRYSERNDAIISGLR